MRPELPSAPADPAMGDPSVSLAREIDRQRRRMNTGAPLPLCERAALLEDLVARAEAAPDLPARELAWAQLLLADVCEELGRSERGLELVDRARAVLEACDDPDDPVGRVRCNLVAAELRLAREEVDLAVAEVDQGFEQLGDPDRHPRLAVGLWNQRARLHSLVGEDYEAQAACEQALELALTSGQERNAIRMLANLAAMRQDCGMLDGAIEACTRARDLCERPDLQVDVLTRAAVYHNLSGLHLRAHDHAACLAMAAEAAAAYRELGQPLGLAQIRNTRTRALRALERADEARAEALANLAELEAWGSSDHAPDALHGLALHLWALHELDGLRRVLAALEAHADLDAPGDVELLRLWDLRLRVRGELPEEVLPVADAALARAFTAGDEEQAIAVLELRVELRERAGDLGGALADQRRLTELQAARLHARMGRSLDRAMSDTGQRRIDLSDLDLRVRDRMGELEAARQRLDAEERARQEAAAREAGLQRDLQRALRLESLGRLAGGVAHDFNNLLTVIRGNAEALAAEGAGPAGEILSAASRGQRMVSQLLAFGRRQDLQLEELGPDDVVAAMDPLLGPLLGEDMELARDLAASGARVRADRTKLESVVVNLLLNACEAMRQGGRAEIRSWIDGDDWVLAVSDQGPGIRPEHQDLVFDPFFTTRDEGIGGGMGLASALGITKRLGGDLRLVESSSAGSVFELRLPLSRTAAPRADAQVEAPEASSEAGPATAAARLSGARILVVEDDAAVRRLVVGALARHGAEVEQAPEGRTALDRLVAGPPVDLVVCDVIMPGMGGPELFRHLVERDLVVPFLFTSGYPSRWNLEEFEGLGRIGFLPKPFELPNLAHRAGELLL